MRWVGGHARCEGADGVFLRVIERDGLFENIGEIFLTVCGCNMLMRLLEHGATRLGKALTKEIVLADQPRMK